MSAPEASLDRWTFGDNAGMANELLALVLSGRKTATCGALASYESRGMAVQRPGERSIITDAEGRDACLIETIEVEIRRFDEVDETFASDEGEGDGTLEFWRAAHRAYFTREGLFAPDMKLVCERFRVVHVYSREAL